MDSINWDILIPDVPSSSEFQYRGRTCQRMAVKAYSHTPWFFITSQVSPLLDVWSYEGNLVAVFELDQPVAATDEVAIFQGIVACFKSLRSQSLALNAVDSNTFCHSDGEYICTLSPRCGVIEDADGQHLQRNMGEISQSVTFKRERMKDAFDNTQSIKSLLLHPAMWSPREDSVLLIHFMALASKTKLDLDHLIMTEARSGQKDWAVKKAISDEIEEAYERNSFKQLVRFARNKIAHFGECSKELALPKE